ncbi:endoribonuclease [Thalassospira xiamenensis]|uniref:RidA family protein n=1 Tax=Thalassospira xiamenensis TaxID=220697 RepID=UPI000DEDFD94|nr:RidA family protein [Thalassospira xiamenensis]RCK34269.1 endoribonuclease [Thalassospira xiamenensis]
MSIQRFHTGPRMSQAVVHGDTIYLAGQVGEPGSDVTNQTKECLAKVDALLAECGASKENILSTTIWLADMADFAKMNEIWDAWVPQGHTPARACGEAKLATPDYLVEFIVVAAKA